MKTKVLWTVGALIAAVASYAGWAAVRAQHDLVTLNVRDMEVRRVVEKIEGQTQERIFVHRDVQGKVTLKVKKVPLETVLRIIGEQTSSRFSKMYPLYASKGSRTALERALRGDIEPALHGWTNLQARGGFPGGGPGGPRGFGGRGGPDGPGGGPMMFGMPGAQSNQLVSLQIYGKDLGFAVTALGRFGQARVVPEDKASGTVNLNLRDATVSDAVAQLAKQTKLKWARMYQLRGDGFLAGRGPDRDGRGPDRNEMSAAEREARRNEREAREAELRAALPPKEQAQAEQARLEREKMFEEMRNLTPEQRRERFAQMGGGREQRNLNRIKNTTPEQRVERYQRMEERRQRGEGRR